MLQTTGTAATRLRSFLLIAASGVSDLIRICFAGFEDTAADFEFAGDVILAAQTLSVAGRVATEDVGHLSLFVEAINWRESGQPA